MNVIQVWPIKNPFTEEIDAFYTDERFIASFLQFTRYDLIAGEWEGGPVPFVGY